MGWEDRDYNPYREQMRAYMGNPGALLQYALPIYKSTGLYIHLSFWFLLSAVFTAVSVIQLKLPLYFILIAVAISLVVALWHELGHRVFARFVGGNHWEWVIWPLGGMVHPVSPNTPRATFVANIGGIVFNAVLIAMGYGVLHFIPWVSFDTLSAILSPFSSPESHEADRVLLGVDFCVSVFFAQNFYMILMNLFPCFWFDGGPIWQSVLWPALGQWKATRVTCLAGMILSVPLFFLSLWAFSLLGMVLWALIFADCFRRRQALAAAGPGVMDDSGPTYNYMDTPEPRRKKIKKRWFRTARKRAIRDQAEQAKIDAILVKVKEKGLHSLTWWEKRTLKKATERQRQQDLAGRP